MKKYISIFSTLISLSYGNLQAGMFDEVEVEAITPSSTSCNKCWSCSADEGKSGKCGEKYVLKLLKSNKIEAYEGQHNSQGHGIDIIGFDNTNEIVLLHESKYSKSKPVNPRTFESTLKMRAHGQQCSLTWHDDAIDKMFKSGDQDIHHLANVIDTCFQKNYTFLRTGNLRVDMPKQKSKIQFYKIMNFPDRDGIGMEHNTTVIDEKDEGNGYFVEYRGIDKRRTQWYRQIDWESTVGTDFILNTYFK
jgi:hypothetical protein